MEAALLSQLKERQRPEQNYPRDPVGYARDILGIELTPDQQNILKSLVLPPYMTKVDSGHSVGKTLCAAVAVSWWYDSFDPGVVITTAPTERDVVDLLWAEVRMIRQRACGPKLKDPLRMDFVGPRAPEMRTSDEHYAKGYTANRAESFQGRHRARMLFIFDEDEGIDQSYFTTTKSMFKPEEGHAWLSIGNPTTTSSAAYFETQDTHRDGTPKWKTFRMSALDHPNIKAGLAGQRPPIPNAVTLPQLEMWMKDWMERIAQVDAVVTDVEFPPGSGEWYRPGPIGCARILGRRPTQGIYGVWSAELWEACERLNKDVDLARIPEIGCDVGHFGDDWTAFHVRWGSVSLYHESVNGWDTSQTAGRCKALAREWCEFANKARQQSAPNIVLLKPEQIQIKVDDDGLGKGVSDQAGGYNFIRISAGSSAIKDEDYPNRRSELWFEVADRARMGLVDIHLLETADLQRLKTQALAPTWKMDAAGRRVVEPKAETKKRLGRSPDDLDAFNLAYLDIAGAVAHWVDPERSPRETMGEKRGFLGRGEESRREAKPMRRRTLGR